jgi:hypothetical protein
VSESSGYHVIVNGETGADETIAGQVAQALCEAYPGHPWHVDVKGGCIIVKHMKLSGKWGQIGHTNDVFSASDLKKAAVRMGGEFLERAGLTRGEASEGQYQRKVEGIPDKDLLIG